MITVRDISEEPELFVEANKWMADMPHWWHEADNAIGELKTYGPKLAFGVWNDDLFTAIYFLQQIGPQEMEVHLNCRKGTDRHVLAKAANVLKARVFNAKFARIIATVLSKHRGLVHLLKTCDFHETGVRITHGQVSGKPAQWIELEAINE